MIIFKNGQETLILGTTAEDTIKKCLQEARWMAQRNVLAGGPPTTLDNIDHVLKLGGWQAW